MRDFDRIPQFRLLKLNLVMLGGVIAALQSGVPVHEPHFFTGSVFMVMTIAVLYLNLLPEFKFHHLSRESDYEDRENLDYFVILSCIGFLFLVCSIGFPRLLESGPVVDVGIPRDTIVLAVPYVTSLLIVGTRTVSVWSNPSREITARYIHKMLVEVSCFLLAAAAIGLRFV